MHEGRLCVDQQLVELDFLEFFFLDHKLDSLLFQLLSEALVFLFQVVFHFLLFGRQQLVDFKLAIEFLLKVLDNKFDLSDFVAKLIVLDLHLRKLPLVLPVGLFLLLHLSFVLLVFLFKLQRFFLLILEVFLQLLNFLFKSRDFGRIIRSRGLVTNRLLLLPLFGELLLRLHVPLRKLLNGRLVLFKIFF